MHLLNQNKKNTVHQFSQETTNSANNRFTLSPPPLTFNAEDKPFNFTTEKASNTTQLKEEKEIEGKEKSAPQVSKRMAMASPPPNAEENIVTPPLQMAKKGTTPVTQMKQDEANDPDVKTNKSKTDSDPKTKEKPYGKVAFNITLEEGVTMTNYEYLVFAISNAFNVNQEEAKDFITTRNWDWVSDDYSIEKNGENVPMITKNSARSRRFSMPRATYEQIIMKVLDPKKNYSNSPFKQFFKQVYQEFLKKQEYCMEAMVALNEEKLAFKNDNFPYGIPNLLQTDSMDDSLPKEMQVGVRDDLSAAFLISEEYQQLKSQYDVDFPELELKNAFQYAADETLKQYEDLKSITINGTPIDLTKINLEHIKIALGAKAKESSIVVIGEKVRNKLIPKSDVVEEIIKFEQAVLAVRQDAVELGIIDEQLLQAFGQANADLVFLKEDTKVKRDKIERAQDSCKLFLEQIWGIFKDRKKKDYTHISKRDKIQATIKYEYITLDQKQRYEETFTTENGNKKAIITDFAEITQFLDQFIIDTLLGKKSENQDKFGKAEHRQNAARLEQAGAAATELDKLRAEHKDVTRVGAYYVPEEVIDNRGYDGDASMIGKQGIPLSLYLYKDGDQFVLKDLTSPLKIKTNKNSNLNDLFEELNSKMRFPKGVVYWNLPNQKFSKQTTGKVICTADTTLSEWLSYIGLGLAAVALTVGTLGFGTPAAVAFTLSGVAVIGSGAASMREHAEQGTLTSEQIALDTATIISGFAGSVASFGRITLAGAKFGQVTRFAEALYKPMIGLNIAADAVSLAVFSKMAAEQWKETDKIADTNQKEAVRKRLLAALMLTGGLTFLSVKGDFADLKNINGSKVLNLDIAKNGTVKKVIVDGVEAKPKTPKDPAAKNQTAPEEIPNTKNTKTTKVNNAVLKAQEKVNQAELELETYLYTNLNSTTGTLALADPITQLDRLLFTGTGHQLFIRYLDELANLGIAKGQVLSNSLKNWIGTWIDKIKKIFGIKKKSKTTKEPNPNKDQKEPDNKNNDDDYKKKEEQLKKKTEELANNVSNRAKLKNNIKTTLGDDKLKEFGEKEIDQLLTSLNNNKALSKLGTIEPEDLPKCLELIGDNIFVARKTLADDAFTGTTYAEFKEAFDKKKQEIIDNTTATLKTAGIEGELANKVSKHAIEKENATTEVLLSLIKQKGKSMTPFLDAHLSGRINARGLNQLNKHIKDGGIIDTDWTNILKQSGIDGNLLIKAMIKAEATPKVKQNFAALTQRVDSEVINHLLHKYTNGRISEGLINQLASYKGLIINSLSIDRLVRHLGSNDIINKQWAEIFSRRGILADHAALAMIRASGDQALINSLHSLVRDTKITAEVINVLLKKYNNKQIDVKTLQQLQTIFATQGLSQVAYSNLIDKVRYSQSHTADFANNMIKKQSHSITDLNNYLTKNVNVKIQDWLPNWKTYPTDKLNLKLIKEKDELFYSYIADANGRIKVDRLKTLLTDKMQGSEAFQHQLKQGSTTSAKGKAQEIAQKIEGIIRRPVVTKGSDNVGNSRRALVKPINKLLGEGLDIGTIHALKAMNIPMHVSSQGSIFEHWVRHNHQVSNRVKIIDGQPKDISFELSGNKTDKKIEYTDQNTGKTKKAYPDDFGNEYSKNTNIPKDQRVPLNNKPIALDMKHIGTRKLGTDEQKQAKVYKQLIDEGKIGRIEYVFSTQKAAEMNRRLLEELIGKKRVEIYYIDDLGNLEKLKNNGKNKR